MVSLCGVVSVVWCVVLMVVLCVVVCGVCMCFLEEVTLRSPSFRSKRVFSRVLHTDIH